MSNVLQKYNFFLFCNHFSKNYFTWRSYHFFPNQPPTKEAAATAVLKKVLRSGRNLTLTMMAATTAAQMVMVMIFSFISVKFWVKVL